jgi:hypothetical protein
MPLLATLQAAREALVLACAARIGLGTVKVSDLADAMSRRLPLPLGEVRVDAPRSAAGDAALLGIGITLEVAELRKLVQPVRAA